jgi:hypothetical protein
MTDIPTTEQSSLKKKWLIEAMGAVTAEYCNSRGDVDKTTGVSKEAVIHVGGKSVSVSLDYLPLYIEALTAASKWLKERSE